MKVKITLELDINFDDEDTGDPAIGDPLETRMVTSSKEAVANAMEQAAAVGFNHDLSGITTISDVTLLSAERVLKASSVDEVLKNHDTAYALALSEAEAMCKDLDEESLRDLRKRTQKAYAAQGPTHWNVAVLEVTYKKLHGQN